ncbi:MAG: histidine kinase dimerization/phospho-acceptor domain-containing protein [Ignavibacterium sp.]
MIDLERLINLEGSRVLQQKSVLEELNRMKNEFMSNISHEFRTPLASIVGFSETIASDPNMPDKMKIEFNYIILN